MSGSSRSWSVSSSRSFAVAGVLVAAVALSACQDSGNRTAAAPSGPAGTRTPSATVDATPVAPAVTVKPGDGATSVRPDQPVVVTAVDGHLGEVTVTSSTGQQVEGTLAADATSWTTSESLLPTTRYTVNAVTRADDGEQSTTTAHLTTLTPKDTASYGLIPSGSTPVGVGMPVVVQFVSAVDADKRADVEKRVHVSSVPAAAGHWGWLDSRQLIWRPDHYWKTGTKVSVRADIGGIETRTGLWTSRDASTTFTVGPAMVSTVNIATHRMTVTRNGSVLRVLKVSTGKPGSKTETRSGTKVIISRESEHTMDSATVGIEKGEPGYYKLKTEWAMRLTWSGEFLHSAPWSVGAQGNANVSHGCTNLSPSDAKWLFDQSRMGDVVSFVGSKRKLESYNGYTMWNESPAQWAQRSAL